jgi:hypothetical protein
MEGGEATRKFYEWTKKMMTLLQTISYYLPQFFIFLSAVAFSVALALTALYSRDSQEIAQINALLTPSPHWILQPQLHVKLQIFTILSLREPPTDIPGKITVLSPAPKMLGTSSKIVGSMPSSEKLTG